MTPTVWVELIGTSAVVISLMFIVLEIRQNTEALSAQALLELNRIANEVNNYPMADEELTQILIKGFEDFDSLSQVQEWRFYYHVHHTVNNLEVAFQYKNEGILQEEDYTAWRIATCRYLSQPSVLQYWQSGEMLFTRKFNKHAEELCDLKGPDIP